MCYLLTFPFYILFFLFLAYAALTYWPMILLFIILGFVLAILGAD